MSLFPSSGSGDLWLSLEAVPRGFPTRLSHESFPQGSPTCHRGVSRSSASKSSQCRENWFPWNGLRHLGDSGNGGTTLEFLSPFLWRAPPLEMRRKRREIFPDHAGKGSLLSRYEAETGFLWMWAGLSCFLSSGDRLFLRCEGNAGNSFQNTQGKDPSSQAMRRKRGSSGCGRDSSASSRVETSMSGNFLSCSKGVKDPLEVPEVRCY